MKKSSKYYVMAWYKVKSTGVQGYYSGYFFKEKLTVDSLEEIFDTILRFLQEDGVAKETDTREGVSMFITNMIKLED